MEKIKIPYDDVLELAIHLCDLEEDANLDEIEKSHVKQI